MSPHIAVNTRLLLPDRIAGIGRFAYEVLKRMVTKNPGVQFSFFFDRAYDPSFIFGENVTPYVIPPQARHPLLWHAWFHYMLPRKINRLKPQVFFSPEFYLTNHSSIPQVPVFHDIAYEHYPKDIGKWASHYCRKYSPIYADRASEILTVSEFSKQDIVQQYGTAPDKISVVYNGASEAFHPIPQAEQQIIRDRYTDGNPYFHFVGTLQPRKNIEHLLKAFDAFKGTTDSPTYLLIVGRKGWKYEAALKAYEGMKYKDSVRFTGYVSDEELNGIYASSQALCYIPYLEGFGIPLLEAMHAETPIICSNITSLPEVAGEAAIMVDPFSIEAITHAMIQLHSDIPMRSSLIIRGKEQRQKFSWDDTYQRVWNSLEVYL